eukprot:SAG22_NODE_1510_length_4262_cov_37.593082_2_plen_124_part_00
MRSRAPRRLAVARGHLAPQPPAAAAPAAAEGAAAQDAAPAIAEVQQHGHAGAGQLQSAGSVATELTAGLRLLDQGGQADLCAGFFSARHPADPGKFLAPSHGTFWKEATPAIYGVYRAGSREQ